jgi:hypothetical protein
MPDYDRAHDADALQGLMNERGLARRRGVGVSTRPVAPTMPRTVDQDNAIVRRKPIAERKLHVQKVRGGTVQQHNRRRIRGAKLQNMQPTPRDLYKVAGRCVGTFDAANANLGEHGKRPESDDYDCEGG